MIIEDIIDAILVGGIATAFYYYRMNKFKNRDLVLKDFAMLFAFSVFFEYLKTFLKGIINNKRNTPNNSNLATKEEMYKLYLDLNNKLNNFVNNNEEKTSIKKEIDEKYNPLNFRPSRAINKINEHFEETKKAQDMYDIRPANFF